MSYKKLTGVKNKVLEKGEHYITLDYGNTYSDGSFHKGLDLVAASEAGKGADYICAFADGKVTSYVNTFSGTTKDTHNTASMGNYVIIDHGNGYKTRYMHMLKGSVKVRTGQTVKKGQVIGYMGNTGNSFGRHLHFDISYNKKLSGSYLSNDRYYLDPKPFLKGEKTMDNKTEETGKNIYVVKVNTVLNVRHEPSVNARIVDKLKNGTKVNVLDKKGDWYKIGENRWVMSTYLVKV